MKIDIKATEEMQKQLTNIITEIVKEDLDVSLINDVTSIAIIGRRGSGKTALSYLCLSYANKPVFVYRHPKPKLVKALGYNILYSPDQLHRMHDCIVWIDEPQHFIKTYDKKANDNLLELLSIARQNDLTLILSTSDTRFITRGIESYIDVWMIKDIETDLIKQGSLAKKIIQRNTFGDANGFHKEPNEFLFYSRDYPQYEGTHSFELPAFFTEAYSKPFKIAKNCRNISEKIKGIIS
jgi:hypothetical protein